MDEEIRQLIQFSHYAGMREDLVQAGGGNSSIKIADGTMLIKASGYHLSQVAETSGYAVVDVKSILPCFINDNHKSVKDEEDEVLRAAHISGPKPSIETFLHAISGRCTLHTHPLLVNVMTSRVDGMQQLQTLFPETLMVGYATPGIKLAREYYRQIKRWESLGKGTPDIVFFKNHGLMVSGLNSDAVIEKTEAVIHKLAEFLLVNQDKNDGVYEIWKAISTLDNYRDEIVYLCKSKGICQLIKKTNGMAWNYEFAPDCIVYCGKHMLNLSPSKILEELTQYVQKNGMPVVVLYKQAIYIIAESIKKAYDIESVLDFSAQVIILNSNHKMDMLPRSEIDFLLDWEGEKYRKNL